MSVGQTKALDIEGETVQWAKISIGWDEAKGWISKGCRSQKGVCPDGGLPIVSNVGYDQRVNFL